MNVDTRYSQALYDLDVSSINAIENDWRTTFQQLTSATLIKAMGQRLGRSLRETRELAELAELLFSAGHRNLALKTLSRLPRQERTAHITDSELIEQIKSVPQNQVSVARNATVVVLYEDESELELLNPLLHGKLRRKNVPLPQKPTVGVQGGTSAHGELQAIAEQHLAQPNTVLITMANGRSETDVMTLSRLSDSPAVIVQIDSVPGTALQHRPLPFIPIGKSRDFPRSCWLRYSLSRKQDLQAWDVATGSAITVDPTAPFFSIAVNQLIARQLLIHDFMSFPAAPLGSVHDQPAPVTRWFTRDRHDIGRLGIVPTQMIASALDFFWSLDAPSVAEQIVQARLEQAVASLDETLRAELLELANYLQHPQFLHQVNVRELWVNNEFESIGAYLRWMNTTPDTETSRLATQADAAVELERLLKEPAATARTDQPGEEHIVCFLHASVPQQSGGYAIRAHGIFTNLADHGVKITAITRPGYPDTAQGHVVSDVVDGIEYHRLPGLESYNHGEASYMLECVEVYKQQLLQFKATKVHVRSTYLIAIPAIIAARQLGLKIVYEVSGLWELVYQESEPSYSLHKRAPFGEYWETLAVQYADEVLTMNAPMTDLLLERGADPQHLNLAPNAVDTRQFTPSYSTLRTTPRIGYIGSIVAYENLDLLVRAVKVLRDEGLRFDVRIIGDGNAATHVRSLISRVGVDDVISMPGRIPHDQVAEEYTKMDIMAYPRKSTLATDTVTPLKPFEALAMGKAVVVSDVPPLREIAGDGTRGLVFQANKVYALADALRTLITDWELREELGKAGRQWVEQERSWSTVVDAFTDAYAKL
ncbi:glycosyltransferase family 4 protein [Micrococcoides hystricis]|uniref:D-inositol 3-phosphate glycosyltransferase n=1 Tax=Micrococcoides hystricis TaxID=1572761 RepID=A0ABV6PC44_9MICC